MLQTYAVPGTFLPARSTGPERPDARPLEFGGSSPVLLHAERLLEQVAGTDLLVLITGETGTGKSLAARRLHEYGKQRSGPLVIVNCGAIPESLVESELFGHEKGAFTGAVGRKLGKVELAANGTLFLDEVGDLAPGAQAKLLQLFQEGTFARVGGSESLRSGARVVAATNRDLAQMVVSGQFRQDLYYRLQVFPVHLPPLRERSGDIPVLTERFITSAAIQLEKQVTGIEASALALLQAHSWPGNVRELEHVVERAVVLCRGNAVRSENISLSAVSGHREPIACVTLEENERRHIRQVLEMTNWVVEGRHGAARILNIPGSTLRFRMKKLRICRPTLRPQAGLLPIPNAAQAVG